MPPDENPNLWVVESIWPEPPLNYVFLLKLAEVVAHIMLGSDWRAPFMPADDPQGFERVSWTIAEAGEAGRLTVGYVDPDGAPMLMEPEHYRSWRDLFISGHLLLEFNRPAGRYSDPSALVRISYLCPIVVRIDAKLDRFLRYIRPKRAKRKGEVVDPRSREEILDAYIRGCLPDGHPTQPEARKKLKDAGKPPWERKSFSKAFKAFAKKHGFTVGRGIRRNRRSVKAPR
jgi:hypothetical protein